MSKLFKLKEWLTVLDAARRLSIAFGEEVSEADVLRLALDGHLKLSVNFVNHAIARRGKVVSWMETEWDISLLINMKEMDARHEASAPAIAIQVKEWPPKLLEKESEIPEDEKGKFMTVMSSLNIDNERYLNLDSEVVTIHGVWDLPMIGSERLDIEHHYQQLIGGPAVTLETMDGAFVEKPGGVMCQLQENIDDNECQPGSKAQLRELKERIAIKKIEGVEEQKLLDMYKEGLKAFLEKRKNRNEADNYYPAGGLPEDAVIVVRTAALREFEQSVNDTPTNTEKPLTTTERNSLLTVIAALCDYSAIDPAGRGAAGQLAKLSEDTCARCGTTDVNFPFIDEYDACLNLVACNVIPRSFCPPLAMYSRRAECLRSCSVIESWSTFQGSIVDPLPSRTTWSATRVVASAPSQIRHRNDLL